MRVAIIGAALTIAISIQTQSAVVFAADSKLTTYGLVGVDKDGKPIRVPQTFDNATKSVQDASARGVAMLAGEISLGPISFLDYVATSSVPLSKDDAEQKAMIVEFANGIAALRAAYWGSIPEDEWDWTVLLLAVAQPESKSPSVWRLVFHKKDPVVSQETLGVRFEGAYRRVFPLMYGYDPTIALAVANELSGADPPKTLTDFFAAAAKLKVLKPIEQLNTGVVPVQDAMDLAYFLATSQIQMERFLPGENYCGGPIDVMVLKTAPVTEILWYPGKALRHPAAR